ncbi:MAG: hypothetical protein KIT16_15645, partial [Rhodospirillaceae bacterium]|nr:hypothetical protein [Rhodospirillaceae bacterium]
DAADLFAAIAPVAATMPADLGPRCAPARPIAVLAINGTADPLVPYQGGQVRVFFRNRGAIWSTDRTLAFWARHDRCGSAAPPRVLPDRDPGDGTRIIETRWMGCAAPVHLLRIEGGGHTWPGRAQYLPERWVGKVNRDIDATEAIWRFFAAAPPR